MAGEGLAVSLVQLGGLIGKISGVASDAGGIAKVSGQVTEALAIVRDLERAGQYPLSLPPLALIEAGLKGQETSEFLRRLGELQEAQRELRRLVASGRSPDHPLFRPAETASAAGWRAAVGHAVFETLRYRHIRYSPTSQAATLHFHLVFDPTTGRIFRIRQAYPEHPYLPLNDEAVVEAYYSADFRKTWLAGREPSSLVVQPRSDTRAGEHPRLVLDTVEVGQPPRPPPRILYGLGLRPSLTDDILAIVEGIDDQAIGLPTIEPISRRVGGIEVVELPDWLHHDNANYARTVFGGIDEEAVTIIGNIKEGIPPPEIWLSVAEMGFFVGAAYAMPAGNSPRGTVREVGTPSLGLKAKMTYDLYYHHRDGDSGRLLRVPQDFSWERRPAPLQATAVETWAERVRGFYARTADQWILEAEWLRRLRARLVQDPD